jgi:CelD/BcsL family acetyltransferase involved in cellulose biosynthesis
VETVRDSDGFSALRDEWDDLVTRCATATPFQAHAWLDSWWRHYGTPGRLRVTLVRHRGRLVGAAALRRERRWWGAVLTPVGGALSDFTDVLLDDAVAGPAARVLAEGLARQRDWWFVDLPETREGASAGRLAACWPAWYRRVPASLCLELPATPTEELVQGLPGHARKTVRRRLNQIARLNLETTAVPAEQAARAVADLVRLHLAQWAGRGGNPEHGRSRFAGQLTDAVGHMVHSGQANILEYRLDGRLVVSNLVLVGRQLAGGYLYGADPALRDRIDIATLLVGSTMTLAHERGCATMSMLRGAEPYKQRWRPREARSQRMLLARPGSLLARARVAGVLAAHVAKGRLRRIRDAIRSRRPG